MENCITSLSLCIGVFTNVKVDAQQPIHTSLKDYSDLQPTGHLATNCHSAALLPVSQPTENAYALHFQEYGRHCCRSRRLHQTGVRECHSKAWQVHYRPQRRITSQNVGQGLSSAAGRHLRFLQMVFAPSFKMSLICL